MEVCAKVKNSTLALQWIKEIEAAKLVGDFITPKSITGKDFFECDEVDVMMVAAESSEGEPISQRETEVAFLIFEHVRPTGSVSLHPLF